MRSRSIDVKLFSLVLILAALSGRTLLAQAPSITSPLSAIANQNEFFIYTITATGAEPITFSTSTLPPGLEFNGVTIGGSPSQSGTFGITLIASNAFGSDTRLLVLEIVAPAPGLPPIITSAANINTSVGASFSFILSAAGAPPISFSVSALPPGLTFNEPVITGVPLIAGTFNVIVTASNSNGSATQTLTINVAATPAPVMSIPVITSPTFANGIVDQPFSYEITAVGTIPIVISAADIPPGLSLTGSTISGVPTLAGSFVVAITATNVAGARTQQVGFTFIPTVTPGAPVITNALNASGTVGVPFAMPLTASGSTPITFTAAPLPPGLSLSNSTISGTPEQSGIFNVTLTAINEEGNDTETLILNIQPSTQPPPVTAGPEITNPALATGILNLPFAFTLTAAGSEPITFTTSALPPGLLLSGNTIAGTPIMSGSFSVTVTAVNILGSDTQALIIQILPAQSGPPLLTIPFDVNATVGQAFTLELTATGAQPIVFTVSNLPPGLTLIGSTITGIPAFAGNFVASVSAVNAAGGTSQSLTFNVAVPGAETLQPPVITSTQFVNATVNTPLVFTLTAAGTVPITFTTPSLPAGLSLVGNQIVGVPLAAGIFTIEIIASNIAGTFTQSLLLNVASPSGVVAGTFPLVTFPTIFTGFVGQNVTFALTANGSAPITFTTTGLPAGLVQSGDAISGIPLIAGTFPVTVSVQNSFGRASQTVLLNISERRETGLSLKRMLLLINRQRANSDAIRIEGEIALAAGAEGQNVSINIAGLRRDFTLSQSGIARSGNDLLKIRSRRQIDLWGRALARISLRMTKGDFAAAMSDIGINDENLSSMPAVLPLEITLDSGGFQISVPVIVNSQEGKTTRAVLR